MSVTKQIATLVSNQILIIIVRIIATAYNLVCYHKTSREGIVNNITYRIRVYTHVATIASAAESTNSTVGKSVATFTSIPCQLSLNISFYRLEIKVE